VIDGHSGGAFAGATIGGYAAYIFIIVKNIYVKNGKHF